MMVRRRSILAAAIALVTVGCTNAAAPDSTADLVWVTGETTLAAAQDVAQQWNQLHPNRPQVRVEALPRAANEQRQLMALELNAGLDQFDIAELDVIWVPEFARRGWLVDLQDLRPDIARASLPGPMQTAVWDGRLWAAPYTTDAGILYYRSDLVDRPPNTWQELIDVGRQVGERNDMSPFVAADGAQAEGLVVHYLEYLWGLGGEVLDRDGRAVLCRDDKAQQAVELMREAFSTGVYAPGFNLMTQEDARRAFQSGEAVFLRSWPYAYQRMNAQDSQIPGKVGIAALPAFDGLPPVAALGGHHLAVSAYSRNIPAASEFVTFVSTSREVQRSLAQRHSLAPTMAEIYHEADLARDPMLALLAEVLPTAKPRPATPEWATISAEMQQEIFAAYTGARDPKAAVEALCGFIATTVTEGR